MEKQFKYLIQDEVLNSDVIKKYITERINDELRKFTEKSSNSLLSTKQVCNYLNISDKTLQKYRKNGVIEYTKIGRKIFYQKNHLDEFINFGKSS
jgi:excisionase family DNA binding protein